MENLEFKGTKDWKVSKFERDSSKRSCYRIDEIGEKGATDKQLEANAKLIEVAPKLLEALENIVKKQIIQKKLEGQSLGLNELMINRAIDADKELQSAIILIGKAKGYY